MRFQIIPNFAVRFFTFLVLFGTAALVCRAQSPPILSCSANVMNYGATGNGTTYDTPSINAAIAAVSGSAIASGSGPGLVYFPPGTYLCNTVHLASDSILYMAGGAEIKGGTDYDTREYYPADSPYASYQDYGHTYFKDALIYGANLYNIGIQGPGFITGNGHLSTGLSSDSGYSPGIGDKLLSLVQCSNIILTDGTLTSSGHFGIIAHACTNIYMNNFHIFSSNSRDAFNLIGGQHCLITNSQIFGSDDAMVLKSTYALGYSPNSYDIRVDHCWILSTENNATQFGSETVGNFTDIMFTNLLLTGGGKAGIGVTMNDGGTIDGVTYCGVTETNCAAPIYLKLSRRTTGAPNSPQVGRIQNVSVNDVVSSHAAYFGYAHASAIFGYPAASGAPSVPVENVVINNCVTTSTGGAKASQANTYPAETNNWVPQALDPYPAYGWFLRHINGVCFMGSSGTTAGWSPNFPGMTTNSVGQVSGTFPGWYGPVPLPDYTGTITQVREDNPDGRPAFKDDNDGANLKIDGVIADVNLSGTLNSPYDMGYYDVVGYDQTNCTGTTPAAFTPAVLSGTMALRVIATSSTTSSTVSSASTICFPPIYSPMTGNYASAQTITLTSETPGVTIRYTTDDSMPSETHGTIYTGPFTLNNSAAIRAIAYESGYTDSAVNTSIYGMTWVCPTPDIFPGGGAYAGAQTVQITSLSTLTNSGTIRYTTDGSTPSETNGTVYTGPITVSGSETIQAIAYASGLTDSAIASATYNISTTAAAPVFSPPGGAYGSGQSVSISSTTPGATIYYTTNGTTPSGTNGTLYTAPIVVNASTNFEAVATASGIVNSLASSANYVISTSGSFATPSLSATATGASEVEQTDSTIGNWEALEATGSGQYIQYYINGLAPGSYDFRMEWKGNNERGILQEYLDGTLLSGSSWEFSGGTATYPLSNTLDQSTNGQSYWYTDYGTVTLTGSGTHVIEQYCIGEDAGATGFWLSAAAFYFIPIPPTISSISNQSISENGNTGPIAFTIGAGGGSASGLVLSATSSNPALLPVSGVVFGGSGTDPTVTVTPAVDESGTASITVTVTQGSEIANSTFTVGVNGLTPVQSWRQQYFGTTSNSGTAGDTADPANDGISNLEKFALGLDPTQTDTVPFVSALQDGDFTLTYTRSSAAASELSITCQWATSPNGPWSSSGVTEQVQSDGPVQTIEDSVPMNSDPSIFFRLQITDP